MFVVLLGPAHSWLEQHRPLFPIRMQEYFSRTFIPLAAMFKTPKTKLKGINYDL